MSIAHRKNDQNLTEHLNNALKFHYPAPVPYGKQEHCDCERVQLMASHIPSPVLPLPSTMTRPRDPAPNDR